MKGGGIERYGENREEGKLEEKRIKTKEKGDGANEERKRENGKREE